MAIEHITFDLPGAVTLAQVSEQKRASYRRVLTKVRLSTLGPAPVTTAVKVKLRLAGVAQAAEYSLGVGLTFQENNAASVEITAGTIHDFIVSDVGTAYDVKVEAEFTVSVAAPATDTTDLGLGTLGQLKRFLLNPGVVAETTYDEAIAFLGRGVAAQIDRFTNRKLARSTSATEDFRGGTDLLLLARYPVEQVISIGLKNMAETSFTTQTNIIDTIGFDTGIISLVGEIGFETSQIRATYDGGYWYDTSDDDTGTLPTGATLLPHEVKMAWLLQCQQVWLSRDAMGVQFADTSSTGVGGSVLHTRLGLLELVPAVKEILDGYTRMML